MNIEEILKDETFVAQLKTAESLDEVVQVCKEKGIDVTVADLEAAMNAEESELDAGELDNVAGGLSVADAFYAGYYAGARLAKFIKEHIPNYFERDFEG